MIKNMATFFRREIVAYFDSPIAYVFILVFLIVTTSMFLFLPPFFTFPRAEMSSLFAWLLPVLCVFIPAATMRVWAEERKENTLEMLLTFPVRPSVLVLGKFAAVMAFYLVALLSTWPVPAMLASLGSPDKGPILSGYIGAMLLGGFFISMGIFISGLCKDQVIAFVLSFLACGAISLFGWDTFATILDGTQAGLGSGLKSLLGMTQHYLPFTRGVLDLTHVLYFLTWIVIFLFLNATYLEGRSRPGLRTAFSATVAVSLVIGVLYAYLTTNTSLGRVDTTEDKIYTVSNATKTILSRLKVPVQIKLYITPSEKMPAEMKQLEGDVMYKLREMQIASKGMIQPSNVHMEASNVLAAADEQINKPEGEEDKSKPEDKERSLEERLMDKGVKPFPVQALREDQSTTQLIYSSMGIAYKEKEEEIIPQIMPQSLADLEYRIVSTVYKLSREKAPIIALVAPVEEVNIPPQMMQFYQQMGQMPPKQDDPYVLLQKVLDYEKYEVRRVKLTQEEPLPDQYDALVVINPRALNSRQKWEISRAIVQGKPTLMAVQNYRWNYSVDRDNVSVTKEAESPGVNEFLVANGLEVGEDILMDNNHQPLTISDPSNPFGALMGGFTMDVPTHIMVSQESMNPNVSITSRLGSVFYLWGSRLKLDEEKLKENKLEVTDLMDTSPKAWTIPSDRDLKQDDLTPPSKTEKYPLAVMVQGQFADKYTGPERPGWPTGGGPSQQNMMFGGGQPPEEEGKPEPAPPANLAPGKLILVGCAQMFTKNFLSQGNMDFFMNSVDALTLGEELIQVRSTKRVDRAIDRIEPGQRAFWKGMVLGLMNVLVAVAGITRGVYLHRARDRYRAQWEARS